MSVGIRLRFGIENARHNQTVTAIKIPPMTMVLGKVKRAFSVAIAFIAPRFDAGGLKPPKGSIAVVGRRSSL